MKMLEITLTATHLVMCPSLKIVKTMTEPVVGLLNVTNNCPPVLTNSISKAFKQRITFTASLHSSITLTFPNTSLSSHSSRSLKYNLLIAMSNCGRVTIVGDSVSDTIPGVIEATVRVDSEYLSMSSLSFCLYLLELLSKSLIIFLIEPSIAP